MRRTPPLSALRAFEAAARLLSFGKAAAELGVTPTAVSHQIRLLEEFCGQSLFRRRPRPLALTEVGLRLFPPVHQAFDALGDAVAAVTPDARGPLRVTTTNAFAHRWLVPRLHLWRDASGGVPLEVIGTDALVDLASGQADLAIRYLHDPPEGLRAEELVRDRFWPLCSPALLAGHPPIRHPADLARHPLVHVDWPATDARAPTWERWCAAADPTGAASRALRRAEAIRFREELHGIEAIIAGQGIAIASDVLVAPELDSGRLVKAYDFALPGLGSYLAWRADAPRRVEIAAFVAWARSAV